MTTSQSQVTLGETLWTPPATLLSHSGQPLDPRRIFFAPPPAEIGMVLNAYSSYRKNESIISQLSRTTSEIWFAGLMLGAIAAIIPGLLINLIPGAGFIAFILALAIFLGVLGFFLWAGLMPTCSYVGTHGIAKYTLAKGKITPEIFAFATAAELRTENTRKYKNNVYQYTTYGFKWTDAEGKDVFKLSGMYHSKQGLPPDKNEYTLAFAGEKAWSAFALERAKQDMATRGSVSFNAVNGDTITLGNGFIAFSRRGEQVRLTRADMPQLSVNEGVVTISSKDTTYNFFGAKGAYKFNYHDIANAEIFLSLYESLM
jgi:hypothetical protein